MATNYKLDIFELLNRLNTGVEDIYASLSAEEKKGFAPLVVMRWMSGTSDERQIMLLNEFVNPAVFPLGKHPHLLMQLLQAASSKQKGRRYNWVGLKSKKKNDACIRVLSEYYGMSQREARLINPMPTKDEIMNMAELLGWQKDDVKKLEKEIED